MSIIHESFKKLQLNRTLGQGPSKTPEPPMPTLTPISSRDKSSPSPLWWAFLMIMILVAAYYTLPAMTSLKTMIPQTKHAALPSTAKHMPVVPAAPSKPLASIPVTGAPAAQASAGNAAATPTMESATPAEPLAINGVMASQGHNIALINGNIYQEGDEISGIKIVRIAVDAVTILRNGKEETVEVRH